MGKSKILHITIQSAHSGADSLQRLGRLHGIIRPAAQISKRHHPDNAAFFQHRQPPDLFACHQLGDSSCISFRLGRDHALCHNFPHTYGARTFVRRHAP